MYLPKDSLSARRRAHTLIDELSHSKAWVLTIEPFKKRRSNPQNSYYWGVCLRIIADETGNDPNDLHEYFLGECFGWQTVEIMDSLKKKPARRSSDMTTEQFASYCEWIAAWAASELGIIIPAVGEGL